MRPLPIALLAAVAAIPNTPSAFAEYRGDTTASDYGSSAYERRIEQGKYQEGYHEPYRSGPTNTDRNNEYQRQREEEDRQRQERMNRQSQGYSYGSGQHRHGY